MRPQSTAVLLTLSIAGMIGYALVAQAVSRRRTVGDDVELRDGIQDMREPTGEAVAEIVHPIGKEWLHVPVSALISGGLVRQGVGARAALPLFASVTSELASRLFDRLPPNRKPPPGHPNQKKPSFPSGHATLSAITYLTLGALLARVQTRRALKAFSLGVAITLTALVGVSRVYLGVHWPTDVLAGWCLGGAWAITCWLVAAWLQRRGDVERNIQKT